MDFTPKQAAALRGLTRHRYIQLSASEAGDNEIQELFDGGLVKSYWGGGIMWHLTDSGVAAAANLKNGTAPVSEGGSPGRAFNSAL